MDRFASLWSAEQAAKHILGVNQEQRDDLANRIRAAILHGVIPSQQAQRPLFPALQAVFVAAYLQHGPAASRVMLPRDAIRWALAQGDIEVCPECREWYARMVPAAGDPVAAADLAKYPRQQRKTAKQGPRKATIAKVIDRGKTLMQNDTLPEFETVWSSIQTKAPAGVLYLSDSDALTTQEGDETLTRTNARRAYEAHRAKSR